MSDRLPPPMHPSGQTPPADRARPEDSNPQAPLDAPFDWQQWEDENLEPGETGYEGDDDPRTRLDG